MKCRLCNEPAILGKGWFNFADLFYPFCKEHTAEYKQFKQERLNI